MPSAAQTEEVAPQTCLPSAAAPALDTASVTARLGDAYALYGRQFPRWCSSSVSCCTVAAAFGRGATLARRTAADAWERRTTASTGMEEGDTYYLNLVTLEQSWVKPERFVELADAVDVDRLLALCGEDATVNDILATLGVRPPSAGVLAARDRLRTALDGRAAADDVTDLHVAFLRLLSLLRFSDSDDIWRDVASMDDACVPELLLSCWMPTTPPVTAFVIAQLLAEMTCAYPPLTAYFHSSRGMALEDTLAACMGGICAALFDRQRVAWLSGDDPARLLSPKASVDAPMAASFAHLLSIVTGDAALTVAAQRAPTATSEDGTSTPLVVNEQSLPWTALSLLLQDAVTRSSAAVVPHIVVLLASLHRLFEVAVLETDVDAPMPTAPAVNPFRTFGVVTPLFDGISGDAAHAVMLVLGPAIVELLNSTSADSGTGREQHTAGRSSVVPDAASPYSPQHAPVSAVPPTPWHRHTLLALLSFATALFELPLTSKLFFSNDIKVLVDVALRELLDLPEGDCVRAAWVRLLKSMITHSQWAEPDGAGQFRSADILAAFVSMYDHTAVPPGLHPLAMSAAEEALEACRDWLS